MNKANIIDDILDKCLERLLIEGETIEQCLSSFPEHSEELKPLLETILATRQVSTIEPRPEFRERARYQFTAALQEKEQKSSRSLFSWNWQPRWVTTAAIILLVLITSGSTIAAASGSMPDSPLYQVKLATEQVQVAVTLSELGKAELHANIADKRVTEIVYLVNKDEPEKMASTTNSLNDHLGKISVLVSSQEVMTGIAMAPKAGVREEAVEEAPPIIEETVINKLTVDEEVPESELTAPAEAGDVPAPPEELAPKLSVTEDNLPRGIGGGDEETNLEPDPKLELKLKITNQAINNIVRLRALLETAPESARPALLRAISVSESGYEQALQSLNQP
ncbi:DUF5667 domain-containing protein [Chloroflexota bacterium]